MTDSARLASIDFEELDAWLRLLATPGVGRITARRLVASLGSAAAVFNASPAAWRELTDRRTAEALGRIPEGLNELLTRTRQWLEEAAPYPRHILLLGDPRYPRLLLELADPPLLLYATGQLALLDRAAVAVVGSRNPTAQGHENARAFAKALSQAGVCVVSGLAQGIDAAAHEGALEGSGSTIAVVGTGLDRLYPRKNLALGQLIAESGLLLSEYALGTPPLAAHFPQRNRIIAGLGLGTLVVEAALQSGSLITARLAIESGRDVMAIPGSIHSPQARGCHALIKQGAKLVESTEDILEELGISPRTNATPMSGLAKDQPPPDIAAAESGDEPDPVLRALGWSPATLDVLQVRTGLSASELTVRLLELELAGAVTLSPGQIFQRLAQA
jgi:DNA processing protein